MLAALRTNLRANGLRHAVLGQYRIAGRTVDAAVPILRLAVQVDGCFWHGCPLHGTVPVRRATYWKAKFRRNRARDLQDLVALRAAGWVLVRVWEHEPPMEAARRALRCALARKDRRGCRV